MKAGEIRELTQEELWQKVRDLRKEIFNLKFQLATAQIENPMKIRFLKKDLARVMTVLRGIDIKGKAVTSAEEAEG